LGRVTPAPGIQKIAKRLVSGPSYLMRSAVALIRSIQKTSLGV
jgi:hypothetical protein